MTSTTARTAVAAALTATLTAFAGPTAVAAEPAAGNLQRISTWSGVEYATSSQGGVVSADGRYAAFFSGDVQWNTFDLYFKDLTTGKVTTVPDSMRWGPDRPVISADGRYVGFTVGIQSGAYLYDRVAGTSTRLTPPDGKTYKDGSIKGISPDGRFVTYTAEEPDPVQYRIRDLVTGKDEPFTANPSAGRPTGFHIGISLSGDGTKAAYTLTRGTGDYSDIFVKDRTTGTVKHVDVSTDGKAADARLVTLTDDGKSVVFNSEARNLVPGSVPSGRQSYRRDLTTNRTVHLGPEVEAVSKDGRYAVTFDNYVNYHVDFTEGRKTTLGDYQDHRDVSLTGDGKSVVFTAYKALLPEDTNGHDDVYVRRVD